MFKSDHTVPIFKYICIRITNTYIKMKRLLFLFALSLFFASCDKGETQLPDDKPKPPDKIIEVKDSIKLIDPA